MLGLATVLEPWIAAAAIGFGLLLVAGILALAFSDHAGPVNIGNPDELSMLRLAEWIVELTGSDSAVEFIDLPVDDPQVRRRWGCAGRWTGSPSSRRPGRARRLIRRGEQRCPRCPLGWSCGPGGRVRPASMTESEHGPPR